MADLTDETVNALNKILADLAAKKSATDAGINILSAGEAAEKLKELQDELKKTKEGYSDLTDYISKEYKVKTLEAEADIAKKRLAAVKDLERQLAAAQGDTEAIAAANKKYAKTIKNLNKELADTNDKIGAKEGLTENLSRLGQSALGLDLKTGGLTEKMVNLGRQMSKAKERGIDVGEAFKTAGTSILKAIPAKFAELLSRGLEQVVEQTKELAKAQETAMAAFAKSTGAGRQYNNEIATLERSTFAAGVTTQEASQAYGALYDKFSAFTQLSSSERGMLSETTALMSELGVSAGTSAQIMDQMTRSLGMSASQTNKVMLKLAGNAKSLGVTMNKMTSDFAGAYPELAKFGDQAIDVFGELAKQSKATGIEVNKLISLTSQFDEFESGAMAVGKLNAVLGGPYLNSIDMLNATEAERIDLLKQSVDMAGVQFDALGRYEKKAIAAALGMSVEEASRIMQMSTAELESQTMEQERLAEVARESQEVMDMLRNSIRGLAINMRPLIENAIVPLVSKIGEFSQFIGKMVEGMGTFGKVTTTVASHMGAILLPMAAVAAFIPGIGIPLSGALLAAAGVSIGGGFAAGGLASLLGGGPKSPPRFHDGGEVGPGLAPGTEVLAVLEAGEYVQPREKSPLGSRALGSFSPVVAMVSALQDTFSQDSMVTELRNMRKDLQDALAAIDARETVLQIDDVGKFSTTVVESGLRNVGPAQGRGTVV